MNRTSPSIEKWENLIPLLWCEVSEILKLCLKDIEKNGKITIGADDPRILNLYKSRNFNKKKICINLVNNSEKECKEIPNPYLPYNLKTDKHLREGLYEEAHWIRLKRFPRLAELTINSCKIATKYNGTQAAIVIPSPLHIIYSFLIDPENSCTAAYALTVCRNWLSRILNVWPIINYDENIKPDNKHLTFLTESELRSSMETFSNYINSNARWPDKAPSSKKNISETSRKHLFVGSYLAVRGFSLLWFSNSKYSKGISKMLPSRGKHGKIDSFAIDLFKNALFVLSPNFEKLPPYEEISNQLFGFPLPMKGMDVLFNGGLRPSSSGGLVMVVSGQPGSGKTSFSLSLVNSLLPFGTPAFYISLEETVSDIKHKLESIKPDFESRLCITLGNDSLFNCAYFPAFSMNFKQFSEQMDKVLEGILSPKSINEPIIAGTCSGVIVIDNLNILDDSSKDNNTKAVEFLEKIIARCRQANLITIFVTAHDLLSKLRLDYLADSVIDLRFDGLKKIKDRPVRIFNLLKSRHQLSRQGAHVFHMGSGKGFRIVPNMDSLIGRRSNTKLELYDSNEINHALNFSKNDNKEFLKIFSRTNILLQGYGSSGKAGLSLRILLTPSVQSLETENLNEISNQDYSSINYRHKVLIVSFLYPDSYYDQLVFGKKSGAQGLYAKLKKIFPGLPKPILKYQVLYPGYIGPQDLLNKIVTKLDESILSGEPYTAVLIDGLHNVFLQYPRLQEADMVWAMLYNILRRYPLTVVSTFTNFSVSENIIPSISNNSVSNSKSLDSQLMQKGMTPFLHALIKATDYYLVLQEETCNDNSKIYPLTVRSAIGQAIPSDIALWNREQYEIEKYIRASDLKGLINITSGKTPHQ